MTADRIRTQFDDIDWLATPVTHHVAGRIPLIDAPAPSFWWNSPLSFPPNAFHGSGSAGSLLAASGLAQHSSVGVSPLDSSPSLLDPTGQLWMGGTGLANGNPDGFSDFRVEHVNSDHNVSDSHVIANINAAASTVQAVGLDTAAGLYFWLDNTLTLHVANSTTGVDLSSTVVGSTSDQDVINNFVVDPRSHTIYMDLFGGDYVADGGDIIKLTYNPSTGAITSPYNPSTFAIDLSGVLVDSTSSSNKYANGRDFVLSRDGSTLYYVDDNNNDPGGFFGFSTNGVYKVSTSGSVGGANAPTPVLLSSQVQFPVNDSAGYITGLAVNENQGIIYFTTDDSSGTTNNAHPTQNAVWWMPIAGGTATALNFIDFPPLFGSNIVFDPHARQLYVSARDSATAQGHVAQLTLSGDGKSVTSVVDNFFVLHPGADNSSYVESLVWNSLPDLTGVAGTTAQAQQGGAALALLIGSASISDLDGTGFNLAGATIRIIGGTKGDGTVFGVASGAIAGGTGFAGDQLFVNGQQSGTVDGGKIAVSWNNSTQTLTLTGNQPDADYQALLSQITFRENGNSDNTVGHHPTRIVDFIVSDGTSIVHPTTGDPNQQHFTLTINRGPVAVADAPGQVTEGATSTANTVGAGVNGNDSDIDGDTVSVGSFANAVNVSGTLGAALAGAYGHLTLNGNGTYSYVADNASAIAAAALGSHPIDVFFYTASDGHGGSVSSTLSFTIDRLGVANSDSFNLFENGVVTTSTVATGVIGNDRDPDTNSNAGLAVTAVNGSAGNVGSQITLASGALLTMNANGTYTYDPNHAFNDLPAAASGAPSTATDSFTYTITGGSTVAVTVTVNGVDSNDQIVGTPGPDNYLGGIGKDFMNGAGGNDVLDGQLGADVIHGANGDDVLRSGTGADRLFGDGNDDTLYFGDQFRNSDIADGGDGNDTLRLNGDYSLGRSIAATAMVSIEAIRLDAGFSYKLSTSDGNVAAGEHLTVNGAALAAGERLTFLGDAETDGTFTLLGGAGKDFLRGGSGADQMVGGAGSDRLVGNAGADTLSGGLKADKFVYHNVTDSNASAFDWITDLNASNDKLDLAFAVNAINATRSATGLGDLSHAFNAAHLGAHNAALATIGTHTFLVVDADGVAGYTAGQDFLIKVDGMTGTLSTATFE